MNGTERPSVGEGISHDTYYTFHYSLLSLYGYFFHLCYSSLFWFWSFLGHLASGFNGLTVVGAFAVDTGFSGTVVFIGIVFVGAIVVSEIWIKNSGFKTNIVTVIERLITITTSIMIVIIMNVDLHEPLFFLPFLTS